MSVPDDHVQASSGGSGSGGPPEVEFKKRRGPSVVWLIPMVALAVAGWLIFTTFAMSLRELLAFLRRISIIVQSLSSGLSIVPI